MTYSITPLNDTFDEFCERYQIEGTPERIVANQAFMQGALMLWTLLQSRGTGDVVAFEMEAYRAQHITYTEFNPYRDKMI